MRLFLLSSANFFCISACFGLISLPVSSPGSSDPHSTSESTAPISMTNIAYCAQKLVEKLNSRMFAADPKQILLFTAKQIMGVSHMKFFSNCYQHVVMCSVSHCRDTAILKKMAVIHLVIVIIPVFLHEHIKARNDNQS